MNTFSIIGISDKMRILHILRIMDTMNATLLAWVSVLNSTGIFQRYRSNEQLKGACSSYYNISLYRVAEIKRAVESNPGQITRDVVETPRPSSSS